MFHNRLKGWLYHRSGPIVINQTRHVAIAGTRGDTPLTVRRRRHGGPKLVHSAGAVDCSAISDYSAGSGNGRKVAVTENKTTTTKQFLYHLVLRVLLCQQRQGRTQHPRDNETVIIITITIINSYIIRTRSTGARWFIVSTYAPKEVLVSSPASSTTDLLTTTCTSATRQRAYVSSRRGVPREPQLPIGETRPPARRGRGSSSNTNEATTTPAELAYVYYLQGRLTRFLRALS
eukprot:1195809-Prorocentrum_minimum.AAC.2